MAARVQNMGYQSLQPQKTIVILGKAGVGKNTMASHIFDDSAAFHIHGLVGSRKPERILHNDTHQLGKESVRVVIIDTAGFGHMSYDMWDVLQDIKSLQKVDAIFFLLKYGRVAKEDLKPFEKLIKGLHQHAEICHLVITGCEGIDRAARNNVTDLYKLDEVTKNFCDSVKGEFIPVGFPETESVAAVNLRSLYEQEMKEDEKILRLIIERSSPQDITVQEPWYCCLTSLCTVL